MASQSDKEKSLKSLLIFTNIWVDALSYIMILIILSLTAYLLYVKEDILGPIQKTNPSYHLPHLIDLIPSVIILIALIALHSVYKKCTIHLAERYINKKYLQEGEEFVDIHKNKISTYSFKFFCYLFSTVFGYFVLNQTDYFPKSLMGNGSMENIFTGYPDMFFAERPKYFDLYYNFNLSFALFDGWILLNNPLQSDFLLMCIHHLSTYSLIVFSFVSGFTAVGSIVFFLHYVGDIFSYLVRVGIHLDISEHFPFVSTLAFLVVFTYTRMYVFSNLIYYVITQFDYQWTILEYILVGFLEILFVLSFLWIVLISRKLINYIMTGNIEEIYKFKHTKTKTN